MNWGGFAGGFAQGFRNGVNMGNEIDSALRKKKIDDVRAQGIAEARAMQQQHAENSVREVGIPGADAAAEPAAPNATLNATPQATPDPVVTPRPVAEGPANASAPVTTSPVDVPTVASISEPERLTSMPQAMPAPNGPAPGPAATIAAQGLPGARNRFAVGDKTFDTREEALTYAQKNAPSVMDFMGKTLVPKMQEAYLAQGDIEKAEAWGKWAKDKKNEKNLETWANAFRAAQAGDMERAAEHVYELYKGYDDGVTPLSKETVKDKNGSVTGFNVRLKDDATGEERTQFIDVNTLTEMGLSALSPPAMFEQVYKRKAQADALAARARIDAQNDARTFARQEAADIRKEQRAEAADVRRGEREARNADRQHGYKLEELATGEQLKQAGVTQQERAKVQAKIDILKENGLAPEAIKELIPHMVGGDGYKKSTSPDEARRLLLAERIKDPMFTQKTPAEQKALIDQDMQTIYGQPAAPANPRPSSAPGAKKGTPYLTPDGKLIYR